MGLSFRASGGAPREIAALPVEDPGGAPPGQLIVEIARRLERREEIDGKPGEVAAVEEYSLRSKWVTSLPAGLVAAASEEPVFSVMRDSESPIPRRASFRLSETIPGQAAQKFRIDQHSIRVSLRFESSQIAGPRVKKATPFAEGSKAPMPSDPLVALAQAVETSSMASLPPPEFAKAAKGSEAEKLKAFFVALPSGAGAIRVALDAYGSLEEKAPKSWLAAAVHAECTLRLAPEVGEGTSAELADRARSRGPLPVRVLAMRLIAHAPVSAASKVRAFRPLLADAEPAIVRFAGRFLGNIRDPASVEALIEGLRGLESRPDAESLPNFELRLSIAQDLYRLLGEGAGKSS